MRPPLAAHGSLAQLTVSINRSQGTVGVAETKTGRTGLARFGNSETRVPLVNCREITISLIERLLGSISEIASN